MNSERIKILHLIAPHSIGGAERVLLTFFHNVDRKKIDLVLGTFNKNQRDKDNFSREAEKAGLPVESIHFKNPYDISQILDLYRIIKKHHPDIIHTHGYKTNILGLLIAKPLGIPIVTTVHGLYKDSTKIIPTLELSLKLLKYFHTIIAVSDNIKAQLENLNIPSKKIITIRNVPPSNDRGLSTNHSQFREEFGIPFNTKLIGFIGRLDKVKGCDYLIKAVSELAKRGLNFCLVIVGDGPERESLNSLVEDLGLQKQIYFCGFRDDTTNVYQSLDLFVLPSLNEGIPLAMLEAMSQGVPVIATRVGGVPEVIQDGVNGLLVPPVDPRALAEAMVESLSKTDEAAKRACEANRKIYDEYSVDKWMEKIQNIYFVIAA
jgi:glycosyltransferase involved in cell wall biosynthesis